jgi:hypothetical protein
MPFQCCRVISPLSSLSFSNCGLGLQWHNNVCPASLAEVPLAFVDVWKDSIRHRNSGGSI